MHSTPRYGCGKLDENKGDFCPWNWNVPQLIFPFYLQNCTLKQANITAKEMGVSPDEFYGHVIKTNPGLRYVSQCHFIWYQVHIQITMCFAVIMTPKDLKTKWKACLKVIRIDRHRWKYFNLLVLVPSLLSRIARQLVAYNLLPAGSFSLKFSDISWMYLLQNHISHYYSDIDEIQMSTDEIMGLDDCNKQECDTGEQAFPSTKLCYWSNTNV